MKKLLSLLFLLSFSLKGSELIKPSDKVIETFTKSFNTLSLEKGVIDSAGNVFVNERINDLVYYKNYFESCNNSKFRALCVCGFFVLPIIFKIYKDSRQKINESLDALDTRQKELRAKFEEEQKIVADEKDTARREYENLPSRKGIIFMSIMETLGNSALEVITDPFSIKSSITIIMIGGLIAYYYKNYSDHAGDKFRSINSLLSLLLKNFKQKSDVLKSKLPAPDIMQQAGSIDIQIKSIVDRYEINNNIKKRVISFLQMVINFIKE